METVIVCKHCGEIVEDSTYSAGNGWDGQSKCSGCGIVEGETKEITIEEYENK